MFNAFGVKTTFQPIEEIRNFRTCSSWMQPVGQARAGSGLNGIATMFNAFRVKTTFQPIEEMRNFRTRGSGMHRVAQQPGALAEPVARVKRPGAGSGLDGIDVG